MPVSICWGGVGVGARLAEDCISIYYTGSHIMLKVWKDPTSQPKLPDRAVRV